MGGKTALASGLAALLGAADSLLYRPWDSGLNTLLSAPLRAMDPDLETLVHRAPDPFGPMNAYLPHYFLPLGIAIGGIALTGEGRASRLFWSIAAAGVNTLVEIGQRYGALPGGFQPEDLLAGIAAGLTAYALSRYSPRSSGRSR